MMMMMPRIVFLLCHQYAQRQEGYQGQDIEQMKADIYWQSEDWDKFIRHHRRYLTQTRQLEDERSQHEVLRLAVALSLSEQEQPLAQLRERYLPQLQNSKFGQSFDVITENNRESGGDVRALSQSIASVNKLETFMDDYRALFTPSQN